jgi:FKBP-type peptidyl-prolyl cis-trans isomerase FkpA
MKNLFWIGLFLSSLLFPACDDAVTPDEQLEIDRALMEEYIAENNLDGTFTSTGLYYVIEQEGSGSESPNINSIVEIVYTGYLLDGTQFDSSNGFPVQFQLGGLIRGWQEGLTYFNRETSGVLLVPSRLAYGVRGQGGIPGNAVLRFEIELLDFF